MANDNFSKEDLLKAQDKIATLLEILAQGGSLASVQGISQEQVEAFYALAYAQYEAGNYDNALKIFNALVLLNSTDVRFYMGQAACCQALKKYENAIEIYSRAFFIDGLKNPEILYNSAMCFLKLGQRQEALDLLEHVDNFASPDNERHQLFLKRCKQLVLLLNSTNHKK